jgi:putative SOS response-associated peptidase YedK
VIKPNPQFKIVHDRNIVILDQESTESYANGMIFVNYLIVLKKVLAQQMNQDFAIDSKVLNSMKD